MNYTFESVIFILSVTALPLTTTGQEKPGNNVYKKVIPLENL